MYKVLSKILVAKSVFLYRYMGNAGICRKHNIMEEIHMKKIIALLLTLAMVMALAACGSSAPAATEAPKTDAPATEAPAAEPVTIKVAAIETGYGAQMWRDVAAAFEAETGIKVELTTDKNLEDVLSGPMQNGEFPDVVHLAIGRPAGLTEQLIKANALHDLDNMLSTTIPGETKTPADKIVGGFTETSITSPYGDGKTYLAPMFYSPCGLFYNAKLFEEKGWGIPALLVTFGSVCGCAGGIRKGRFLLYAGSTG